MWNNILSTRHGQNGKEHNKYRPTFKLMLKLKVSAGQNPNLNLKYKLTFKCEIKFEVVSQFKWHAVGYSLHLNWLKTSSLISYLNVKLYFKYSLNLNWNRNFKCEFGFCPGWNFKFQHVFKCWSVLIVFLPVLATAHTLNIASRLNSIKTLNVVNTFKIKFKVHLNFERTEVELRKMVQMK